MSDLFTLDQAKSWLGLDPSSTDYDDRLAEIISATRTIIETRTGTLAATSATHTVSVDAPVKLLKIVLPHYPITAVTGVTIEGETVDADMYRVYTKTGVVKFLYGLVVPFDAPANSVMGDVVISYTYGSDTVTDNIALAAKIIAQDIWQELMIQQATGQDTAQVDPQRYLWPRRAMMLVPKRGRFA